MIYSIIITSVSFPEPLFERNPGRTSRTLDTVYLSSIIMQVGEGKFKSIVVDEKIYASVYQVEEFVGLVIHDGDYLGAEAVGARLKKYFARLLEEGSMPGEEALEEIAYGLLPTPEEIQRALKLLSRLPEEPFVSPSHAFERVSLFTALSATFRRALRPPKKERILEKFFEGDRKYVLENGFGRLDDPDVRIAFIKSAIMSYASTPKFPVIEPGFVDGLISRIEEPVLRDFLRVLLDYAAKDASFGNIVAFARERAEDIAELAKDPIKAAAFAFPMGIPEAYPSIIEALPEGSYFREMMLSLKTLSDVIEAVFSGNSREAASLIDGIRERVREGVKTGNFKSLMHRLYAYVYAEYLFASNAVSEARESVKRLLRVSSLLPSSIVQLMAAEEEPLVSYARVYPAVNTLDALRLIFEYYNVTDPAFLRTLIDSYSPSLKEFVSRSKRYIAAGRVPADQLVQAFSGISAAFALLSEIMPRLRGISNSIAKLLSNYSIDKIRAIYENIDASPAMHHIRTALSVYVPVLLLVNAKELGLTPEEIGKLVAMLERVLLHYSIKTDAPGLLMIPMVVVTLLRYVLSDGSVIGEDRLRNKLESLKRLVYRIEATPVAKFVMYRELYETLKKLGSSSDELLEVYNYRVEYRESHGGEFNVRLRFLFGMMKGSWPEK